MAAQASVIGRTTRVRGRVTGPGDLDVKGFVDGEIVAGGDVTVDVHGMVGAGIRGRRLLVRGAVKGDLVGEEAVVLEEGARVVGDVRAPRVAVAPGALLRGFVQTGEPSGSASRAARPQAAPRPAPAAVPRAVPAATARAAPSGSTAARAAPAPASSAAVATARAVAKDAAAAHGANNTNANSTPRRPPPPVVPALKKARGQIAKRKER